MCIVLVRVDQLPRASCQERVVMKEKIWNHFQRRVYSPVILMVVLLAMFLSLAEAVIVGGNVPVWFPFGHSHNDYEQTKPLLDALENGFNSVEADIHQIKGQLLVAHDADKVAPSRTLTSLYLEPLAQRIAQNGGFVQSPDKTFWLMIDIKSDATSTFTQLRDELSEYEFMLTDFARRVDGHPVWKPVSVVISGNRDFNLISAGQKLLAALDARVGDIYQDGIINPSWAGSPAIAWVSDNWASHFSWNGDAPVDTEQSTKLQAIVEAVHSQGLMLRFWNIPDNSLAWTTLRFHGVDLINTDRLAAFHKYFSKN